MSDRDRQLENFQQLTPELRAAVDRYLDYSRRANIQLGLNPLPVANSDRNFMALLLLRGGAAADRLISKMGLN